jgi:transposase
MQGRKPDPFILKKQDVPILQQLLRDGQTSQRIARRARILLNRTRDQRVNQVMLKVDRSASTVWRVCERYYLHGLDAALYDAPRSGRPLVYSPQVRKRIENLACTEPATVGWHLSHWSTRSLEQAAIQQEIVARIHYTTIGDILRAAHLRPDRFRYWKTAVWDAEAIARTIKILWYYERIQALWRDGTVVIALDEKPNIQVLERTMAKQLMRPGYLERQAFDYIRHGTVNLLVGLTLYNGRLWAECLDKNDGAHFRPAVCRLLHPYGWARRIALIVDNGPSHTSGDTLAFFEDLSPRVRVLFTPPNASWLNQAELLLRAFTERYINRGSWATRAAMIAHLLASRGEYNQYFAHPFNWGWTRHDFHYWLNNTPGLIHCKT